MQVKKIALFKVADVFNGKTPAKSDQRLKGHPVLKIKDVSENGTFKGIHESYVDFDFVEKFQSKKIVHGDTLILNAAHNADYVATKIYKAETKVLGALATGEWTIVRPNQSVLDAAYAFYWIISQKTKHDIRNLVKGIHLYPKDILRLEIPLPPIEEQRRIAAILDQADAVRRKRQEAIRLTEELLRATFLDMFGDPVTNPKGWDVYSLGSISIVKGGLQVTSQRVNNPIEVPYLRVANVYRNKLNLDEIKTIRVTQNELERTKLKIGDILIVEGHGNSQEIGRCSIWDGSILNCTHQNHLIRVQINDKIANSTYISAFLNSHGGRRQLIKFGKTTSGLNTISSSNVKSVSVLVPSIAEQEKYVKIDNQVNELLDNSQTHLQYINELFNSLLQRAFRGEL
ncbi:MAG: restriction endonuclease subunit S [Spirulina sp. DLM2.Bin59]|nr:MAG: restriction endonuclease subunit S [Spirulina sp. DLM2.Bin59]